MCLWHIRIKFGSQTEKEMSIPCVHSSVVIQKGDVSEPTRKNRTQEQIL